MAKKAFLVKTEFWTRIVIDESATDEQKMEAAKPQIKYLAEAEFEENVVSMNEDIEIPYTDGETNPYTNQPY